MKEFKDKKHREKIVDRIKKILALASKTSFEGEAKTAMRMAKGLMKSFGLTMSEVEIKESVEDNIVEEMTDISGKLMNWKKVMAMAIEELCDTRLILTQLKSGKFGFKFIGLKDDVKLSIILFNSFKLIMRDLAVKNYSSKIQRTSYLLGLADRLLKRAEKETVLAKEEVSTYNALVVVKEKEINKYVDENLGKIHTSPIKSKINTEAYAKGYVDGDKIDLQNKEKIK